jgi:phosphonate transport system substrate-binding protein
MISAEATFSTYRRLVSKVAHAVGRQETFVLRPSYADVRRALEKGEVDVALVCTGTYVHALPQGKVRLLVQPEFEEGLEYRSLLIVPAASSASRLEDLRGGVVAFTDAESNTGCLVPRATLAGRGWQAGEFFREILFTGSHDRSIQATALGIVDAAAVDSLIWESAKHQDPALARSVRVIWASEAFGPPPIVVPVTVDERLAESLRDAFLSLGEDSEGRQILSALGIRRFVPARSTDYRSAVALYESLQGQGGGR